MTTSQKTKTSGTSANKTNKKQAKEKLKEQVFEYVSPKIGEDGMVIKNDTTWNQPKK